MPISPTAEGFRAAFRRPTFALAEISWRWATGAAATALFLFGLFEYLNTLPVNRGELLFLRSRHPYLVAQALAHIFGGTLSRAVMSALLAALVMIWLWIIVASLGRIATVRAIVDYFRSDVARNLPADGSSNARDRNLATGVSTSPFQALTRLNFLRVAVAVAAIFGFLGASILASFVSPNAHPRPVLAFMLLLLLAGVIWVAWGSLNWLLSLAGLFSVRDSEDAVGAVSAAVGFCRERTGAVAAVSTWTGLAHLVALVGATSLASMPLGFAGVLPWRLVVLATLLVTMAYFALADWLYMARLAGYVCIMETPEALLRPLPPPIPTPPPTAIQLKPQPAAQTSIDRDELILTDVPLQPKLQTAIDRQEPILSDVPGFVSEFSSIDAEKIVELVELELAKITDAQMSERIRQLLVPPYPVLRDWDYSPPDSRYTCWTVLEHRDSNTGIAYCEQGFGPTHPWGLVHLSGPHMSIGMDCSWYQSLEDAIRESATWDEPNPEGSEVQ